MMIENFPNLVKEKDTKVQEAQRVPNSMNLKRTIPRHIIIKMAKIKDKERSLKAARECQIITYKGVLIKLSTDFSTETFQTKRGWHEIFKVMKSKDLQPRVLYVARLSFKTEGEIKSFPDKKKLKEFITTKLTLYKILKGLLLKNIKNINNKMAIHIY